MRLRRSDPATAVMLVPVILLHHVLLLFNPGYKGAPEKGRLNMAHVS